MKLRLYGSLTSPYVRRVRMYLEERGLAYEWVDTTTEPGQAQLRALTPLWKIPALELDGDAIFDSTVILQELEHRLGPGPLGAFPATLEERNVLTAVDGAMDSLINVMYLEREGVQASAVPYLQKQRERARASLGWVGQRARPARVGAFTWTDLWATPALEWMLFRNAFPVGDDPQLITRVRAHAARPSVVRTRPAGLTAELLQLTPTDR